MAVVVEKCAANREAFWNDLPDLVISQIFSYLSLSDRIRASVVCRNWSKGFHSPILWRSINVWINADPSRMERRRSLPDSDSENSEMEYYETRLNQPKHAHLEEIEAVYALHNKEEELKCMEITEEDPKSTKDKEDEEGRERAGEDCTETKSLQITETDKDNEETYFSQSDDESEENFYSPKEDNEYKVKTTLQFSDSTALTFADKYGKYVKRLQLICDPIGTSFEKSFQEKVFKFLNSLIKGGCQLHEMVVFLSYFSGELEKESRRSLIEFLSEFFLAQHELEKLTVGNSINENEICLLKAIVEGSGATLKHLHCIYYVDREANIKNKELYCSLLGQMAKLQIVGLSVQSMGKEEALILNQCKNLESVYLYNLGRRRNAIWRNFSPQKGYLPFPVWKKCLKIHPKMTCSYGGEYWIRCTTIPKLELPFKPIVYVNTQFELHHSCLYEEETMNGVINFIATNYATDLVSIYIVDEMDSEIEDEAIRKLLMSCPELRELKLKTTISLPLFEEIHSLQIQNKIDLHTFWFKSSDFTEDDLEKLKTIRKKYDALIKSRDWWCQVMVLDRFVQRLERLKLNASKERNEFGLSSQYVDA